jgi:hypothetical protein
MRAAALLVAVVLGGGCAKRVDRDLLRDLTVESKLVLFEAENEVSIALDEVEQLTRQIRDTRAQVKEIDVLKNEADADADRARARKDEKAVEVAKRAYDILDLKRRYVEQRVRVLKAKLAAQDKLVRVSYAKYELAKAKLVKKNNVRGADKIELADYESQVDKVVEKAREAAASVDEAEKEAAAKKQEWVAARNQLESSAGGGASSPWADDASAWGTP